MLSKSEIYLEELRQAKTNIPAINVLKNKSIMITGANGMICSALIDFIITLNNNFNFNIKIYAAARSESKTRSRFKSYWGRDDFVFVRYNALEKICINENIEYYIHGASNANPKLYVDEPVETMLGNIIGLKNILDYSKIHNGIKILYLSSSEVYGKKNDGKPYKENEYAFLDILNPRASYPSSKRAAETLAMSYVNEYNINVVIARPGHVYGPTMTISDTRAVSQFARNALMSNDIIMKSEGKQLRSHCYIIDCVTAIFTILINGKSGNAYNIGSPQSVSTIKQIANAFALACDKKVIIKLPLNHKSIGDNLMDNSSLNVTKLMSLGWESKYNLEEGTKHTVEILKEIKELT